jgi:dolichyl-phosphate beta-glucosyltransferase
VTALPQLSVVIPAYNEERRLPPTLDRLRAYLGRYVPDHEIIVVDDGSRDATADVARTHGATVVSNDGNRGKGFAARRGMLLARGQRRLMTDADLSTPIEDLDQLMARLDEGYGVAIASRALPGSNVEVRQSAYREAMGRLFNVCVRVLAVPGLHDTQCGFKLFTAEAADAAFAPARLDGFSFDVETLFIARRRGFRIAEVPVTWRNDEASRVGPMNGLRAFLDLGRIRLNGWRGLYG